MTRRKKQKRGPRAKPGEQGLSSLGTWRLGFSEDIKRRSQQKRENRRPHRVRGAGAPSSLLGTPEAHWSEPAKPGRRSRAYVTAPGTHPKSEPATKGTGVLDRRVRVRRGKR